jgi:hypothetical protein
VAGRQRHVVDVQTEYDGENYSTLSHSNPHATSACGCFKGRYERPTEQIGRDGFDKVREGIKDC